MSREAGQIIQLGGELEHKPTDIQLEHAFVVLGGPAFFIGPEVTGSVSDCHFWREVGYVPSLWRRSRLRRLRPLVGDLMTVRALWRWLRD